MGNNGHQNKDSSDRDKHDALVLRDEKGYWLTSGNPAGRPRRTRTISSMLIELLDNPIDAVVERWKSEPDYPTGAMTVALALFKKMTRADMTAIKEGLDRTEGKVPQAITGAGGGPIQYEDADPKDIPEKLLLHLIHEGQRTLAAERGSKEGEL
tara:strand:- start:491 stop:952 length:462 start_codon:yes stop_codon:yes gene_type:complete